MLRLATAVYPIRLATLFNQLANAWGIWHMGRFAADYRKLFGEVPSETLQA